MGRGDSNRSSATTGTHKQPAKAATELRLVPSLSLLDATAISLGAIVGAGIYVVTGIAAGFAGSAVIVSMLVAALVSSLTALSFAELTAWSPREGSVYEYAHELISPFAGFLTGWMWILSNTFTGAAVALGFAHYLVALIPIAPTNWVAACICCVFAGLNYFGIRHSARVNNVLVVAKILILGFFIVFGFAFIHPQNLTPFVLSDFGVVYGTYFIFFAYGGFARVAVVAEEVKDARRNVPRAILLSLVISTVVYVFVALVAVGLVSPADLARSGSPLALAISVTGSALAVYLVSFGALIATASVLLTTILGVSRMTYAMAIERDLPKVLARIHPKYNTPHYAVLIVGVVAAVLAFSVDLSGVVAIGTFALLFYYTLANVAAFRLPAPNRSGSRVVPFIGAASCLALLLFALFLSVQSWLLGITGLGVGACYYVGKTVVDRRQRIH
jgi:APA family basic amino acid/polyamine antiporter